MTLQSLSQSSRSPSNSEAPFRERVRLTPLWAWDPETRRVSWRLSGLQPFRVTALRGQGYGP